MLLDSKEKTGFFYYTKSHGNNLNIFTFSQELRLNAFLFVFKCFQNCLCCLSLLELAFYLNNNMEIRKTSTLATVC